MYGGESEEDRQFYTLVFQQYIKSLICFVIAIMQQAVVVILGGDVLQIEGGEWLFSSFLSRS